MLVALSCWAMLLTAPSVAAACSRAEQVDLRATMGLVASLRAAGSAGGADAAAVLQRARRSCTDARFARAAAAATSRHGAPTPGRRARVLGLDLVGSAQGTWRLDVARLARRLAAARSAPAAGVLRGQLRAAGFGRSSITFSADPTQLAWDAELQSAVVAALARSPRPLDRTIAGAGARAFAPPARRGALAGQPLLAHLRVANRVALAADASGSAAARVAARGVAARAFVRVRAARQAGWSRIDGSWATVAAHRTLVAQSSALVARLPHATTAQAVQALRAALTTPPDLDFGTLPAAAFYPWPRDAAFDTQSVSVSVDKPGSLTLTVYGPDGGVVRSVPADVLPGPATLSWDGTAADGSTLGPGEYRYNLDAVDLAGNHVRVPGLDEFEIARDTTPPTVHTASVRHLVSGGTRRLVASWDVEEVHSPNVRTWLLLQSGAERQSLDLHPSLQRATVRRIVTLARGTWRASYTFVDGSGNRTSSPAGTVVVH